MKMQLFPVISAVVSDPRVIFTAIFVFVYLNIVGKVVRYRKKPRPVKARKSFAPPPEAAEAAPAEGGEGGEE